MCIRDSSHTHTHARVCTKTRTYIIYVYRPYIVLANEFKPIKKLSKEKKEKKKKRSTRTQTHCIHVICKGHNLNETLRGVGVGVGKLNMRTLNLLRVNPAGLILREKSHSGVARFGELILRRWI